MKSGQKGTNREATINGRVRERGRKQGGTFCQLCVLISKLLPSVSPEEAVVAQATGVRQTLHYRV